jgi:dCTP deaminase
MPRIPISDYYGLMPDSWILDQIKGHPSMISGGLVVKSKVPGKISAGVTSYGYDMTLAPEYKVFSNVHGCVVDPKKFDPDSYVDVQGETCIIPPNSFALGRSVEYFRIPDDVMVVCVGKSTYARCGIIVGITPLEPGWEGYVTIEISNSTPLPVKVYANEGISQALFYKCYPCDEPYGVRSGKYQSQEGITLPKV